MHFHQWKRREFITLLPGGFSFSGGGRNDPCKWEFSYLDPRKQPMAGYSFYPLNHSFYPLNLREWLLGIGRQLQAEYDDAIAAAPVPERIGGLLKQLETASNAPERNFSVTRPSSGYGQGHRS
jgi:hypothetical protein